MARDYLLDEYYKPVGRPKKTELNDHQIKTLWLLARGNSFKQIAEKTKKPIGTVYSRLTKTREFLGASNNTQALVKLLGNVDPEI